MLELPKQNFALNFFPQQGGTEFIPVKVGRSVLQSMNRHEVFIKRWPQPLKFNYYKSIMPDVAITLCQSCNRVSETASPVKINFFVHGGVLLQRQFELKNGKGVSSKDPPLTIEIINNTRAGIVIFFRSKKGNALLGGQIPVPDTLT